MRVDRYDPVNLSELIPELRLEMEPELVALLEVREREEAPVDQLAMGRLELALYGRGVLVASGHREELPQGVSTRTNVLRWVLRPPDVCNSW